MEGPQEVFGTLASGGSYRATPELLEIRTPTGEVTAAFDTRFFNAVTRQDRTITIGRLGNSSINVTTGTLPEAEALERLLASTGSIPVSAQPSGSNPLTHPVFKWGCIGALIFVGLGAICLIAGLFLFRDSDSNSDASLPSPVPTVTVAAQVPPATAVDDVEAPTEPEMQPDPTDPATEVPATQTPEPELAATATPTSTPEPNTPVEPPDPVEPQNPAGPGMTRSSPLAFGERHSIGDWELQVLEVVRGQEAYDTLLATNQFNSSPPEGHEYVLVNLHARYTGTADEPQQVDGFWLQSTGSARVLHQRASVVDPEPVFQATLLPGGEVSGWTTVLARAGESDLLLVWEDWWDFEADPVYLALEPGASVESPSDPLAEANDLGRNVASPVPFGQSAITETWELRVLEHVRGQEALDMVMEANQFNSPPEPGMEYVVVRVNAVNIGTARDAAWMSSFSFGMTGSSNQVFDSVFVVDPAPALDFNVFAGGEVSGWLTVAVPVGEQNLVLVFEDWLSFFESPRYLALE